jgi:hypothetical protein
MLAQGQTFVHFQLAFLRPVSFHKHFDPNPMTVLVGIKMKLTWGFPSQRVKISSASVKLQWLFRYPRSEPFYVTWSLPHQIKLTFGRRSRRLHQDPACGGWGSGERDHS